jgi:hypothetical protein
MTHPARLRLVALALAVTMAPKAVAQQAAPRPLDRPLQVLLLADRSGSMSFDYDQFNAFRAKYPDIRPIPDLRIDLPRSLSSGLRQDASVQFGSFGRSFMFSRFVAPDRPVLEAAMAETEQDGGPSPIWDAMSRAAASLAARDGDRIVLLITDGRATGNVLGVDDALKDALAAGVRVFVFDVHDASDMNARNRRILDDPDGPNRDLRRIAVNTNGEYIVVFRTNRTNLPRAVEKIVKDLSAPRRGLSR